MQWIKKGKYYAELKGDSNTTISWNESQDEYWLTVANEPIAGTFKTREEVKQYYEDNFE